MEAIESAHIENMELLMEIVNLKTKLSKIYKQIGPSSSEYVTLSIKLNLLMNKYFEEKTKNLVRI
ncbi:Spo0E family sporulation regulatory protein-aspartic acid phosphatase [Neobacillus drentensis]|uniref:Spo0E family sporulation regulatory protein-aspartic acid phosphatase n=1 Tax=Neobacillus drentensis TaxID=220684 RepID=UPI003000BB83